MNDEPRWTQQAKALLDASVHDLDAATLSRLNRARQAALAQRRKAAPRWFVPAGLASACALVLAVAVWHGRTGASRAPGDVVARAATADDADLVADDFYADMEFYAWLDAQDQGPPG